METNSKELASLSAMVAKVETTKTDSFQDQDSQTDALQYWEASIKE
jgi:hypothetical protein